MHCSGFQAHRELLSPNQPRIPILPVNGRRRLHPQNAQILAKAELPPNFYEFIKKVVLIAVKLIIF
jgi:hypothetical protein